jgi:hypothetical protein
MEGISLLVPVWPRPCRADSRRAPARSRAPARNLFIAPDCLRAGKRKHCTPPPHTRPCLASLDTHLSLRTLRFARYPAHSSIRCCRPGCSVSGTRVPCSGGGLETLRMSIGHGPPGFPVSGAGLSHRSHSRPAGSVRHRPSGNRDRDRDSAVRLSAFANSPNYCIHPSTIPPNPRYVARHRRYVSYPIRGNS